MKAQGTGGSIVNTVSAVHFGNFGQTNYAGSKGAIALMVTAEWDPVLRPEMAAGMGALIPDLETVTIPRCGH